MGDFPDTSLSREGEKELVHVTGDLPDRSVSQEEEKRLFPCDGGLAR
jgi:hypothetical protein